VPVTQIHDFVSTYSRWVKKPLGKSTRDLAIIEALKLLPDGVLEKEKKEANIAPLAERLKQEE
jgi:hypothetical protein